MVTAETGKPMLVIGATFKDPLFDNCHKRFSDGIPSVLPKPADSIDWLSLRPWLNWIEHWVADPKVAGSSPAGRIRISLDFIVTHLKVGGMEPGDVARAQKL